jgi:hypothetical protein
LNEKIHTELLKRIEESKSRRRQTEPSTPVQEKLQSPVDESEPSKKVIKNEVPSQIAVPNPTKVCDILRWCGIDFE